ncbi:hypothetical protein Pcinc_019211 [Petrolisthes cinctipes]|uniref:Uncharacterized protein n=1 Tax=Petrolisthes cinctipes TaxID=88211 RepID=A0AAE1KMY7_PETCI|nr:hypothetical protein Pcinc_019211 [Petrolisthes cinctipes]
MAETRLTKRSAVNLGTAQPALSRARLVSSLPGCRLIPWRGREGEREIEKVNSNNTSITPTNIDNNIITPTNIDNISITPTNIDSTSITPTNIVNNIIITPYQH